MALRQFGKVALSAVRVQAQQRGLITAARQGLMRPALVASLQQQQSVLAARPTLLTLRHFGAQVRVLVGCLWLLSWLEAEEGWKEKEEGG